MLLYCSVQFHTVAVTLPVKIHIVVISCTPGQLGNFLEELNMLLSSFPEDGSPLVLFGDFNIHLEKLMSRFSVMKDPTAVRCLNKNFYWKRYKLVTSRQALDQQFKRTMERMITAQKMIRK